MGSKGQGHKKTGGVNNKMIVRRHGSRASKSCAHRSEKRVETRVRNEGKKAIADEREPDNPVCRESPDGKHDFSIDYEYDESGRSISCCHCGEGPPFHIERLMAFRDYVETCLGHSLNMSVAQMIRPKSFDEWNLGRVSSILETVEVEDV